MSIKDDILMKVNVGIVTFPLCQAGHTPLSNLVKSFSRLAGRVYVVSGGMVLDDLAGNVQVMRVDHKASSKVFMRILNYMNTQLKILCHVVTLLRKVNLFVFFIGGEGLLVPMLVLKLLRKKVVLMPGGAGAKALSIKKDPLSKFMSVLVNLNLRLADRLIVYSPNLIREGNFARYQRNILVAHHHFVDFTTFIVKKKIDDRLNVVGYIGRLSEEKGILNLVKAIPLVLKERKDICFILGGEGGLSHEIRSIVKDEGLKAYAKLIGWIPHDELPKYLNELKLLVLPSYTEGLPNIMLEAMACGTPVLVTQVGAIPCVIEHRKNGFILKKNSPECIAKNILKILNRKDLQEISQNARRTVEKDFTYEAAVEGYNEALRSLQVNPQ